MKNLDRKLITFSLLGLLAGCCVDFFDIAWGTGVWLGEFSPSWAILFVLFCFCTVITFFASWRILHEDKLFHLVMKRMIDFRTRLGLVRFFLAVVVFAFPLWLLQFSIVGVVVQGAFLRISLWVIELLLLSFLLTAKKDSLLDWTTFLFCLVLTAGSFSFLASLRSVTDYPFSLGWSEGNRLWDYSILFGQARYQYPEGQKIAVLLEPGRLLVGAIPFLIPGLTISMERAWISLVAILPYIVLGLVTFRLFFREKYMWLGLILWGYIFLNQGPIHAPLVLCAIMIGLAWRNNIWFSTFLVLFSSVAAYMSRYTWTFAPAIWFLLLEILDPNVVPRNSLELLTPRIKAFLKILGVGVICGLLAAALVLYMQPAQIAAIQEFFAEFQITPENLYREINEQALLWYRLLPNETYRTGILIGIILATLPLIFMLVYLSRANVWVIIPEQRWAILFFLAAFFTVGLIVSTKIGGGGDLHNMDMFLISLFFLAAIALHGGGKEWLERSFSENLLIKSMLVLLIAVPAIGPLQTLRSQNFADSAPWLVTLTDVSNERALDMYPADAVVKKSLMEIQHEVDLAKQQGDVLFMDQRQLLTFGFIHDVWLVPDYDKKMLMESALSGDREYFQTFYKDLAAQRFSLIIVQPMHTTRKGSGYEFGEENNAWVRWVARPLLCFYEIKQTLVEVNVQLLVPKLSTQECAALLP